MDALSVAASAGLRTRAEALDMLANNIANAGTAGFKRDGEFYSLYQDAESAANGTATSVLPTIEKPWIDHAQGTLNTTGAPTDLALSGNGYFSVNTPNGTLYTRNGNFRVGADGTVATQEGHAVRLVGGNNLRVRSGAFEIGTDGTVRQGGAVLGKLDIVELPKDSVVKQGATLFRPSDPAIVKPTPARNAEVHQGKLESANVSAAESAVRLINVTRQFEALQKAIGIGGEMGRKAIEEVARVGQ